MLSELLDESVHAALQHTMARDRGLNETNDVVIDTTAATETQRKVASVLGVGALRLVSTTASNCVFVFFPKTIPSVTGLLRFSLLLQVL